MTQAEQTILQAIGELRQELAEIRALLGAPKKLGPDNYAGYVGLMGKKPGEVCTGNLTDEALNDFMKDPPLAVKIIANQAAYKQGDPLPYPPQFQPSPYSE